MNHPAFDNEGTSKISAVVPPFAGTQDLVRVHPTLRRANPIRLLKNRVRRRTRSIKPPILRSSWRILGRWNRAFGLCSHPNPILWGCRAWVAHC